MVFIFWLDMWEIIKMILLKLIVWSILLLAAYGAYALVRDIYRKITSSSGPA